MKIVIKITENGYSKTVELDNGETLIEKWERNGNGFGQTHDSINFEDTDLLDDTIKSLSDLDFEISELCDALENENAEICDEGDVPTTDDGHVLKKGDVFYTIASAGKQNLVPLRLKFPKDWGSHGSKSYISKLKCSEECDRLNSWE
jgi:hypothetical protein